MKSWLLAIPHLLIIGVLTGTARSWEFRDGRWVEQDVGISLLGLLVLIAGVILLFTGRYWPGLFELLLGLNRWIYRVVTYVGLRGTNTRHSTSTWALWIQAARWHRRTRDLPWGRRPASAAAALTPGGAGPVGPPRGGPPVT